MALNFLLVFVVALIVGAIFLEYAPNSTASVFVKNLIRRRINSLDVLNNRKILDVSELSLIEKDISGLSSVVLVAAEAQAPKNSDLAPAVIDNFKEAVRYRFFISSSWKENTEAIEKIRNVFKALYNVALETADDEGRHSRIKETEFDDVFQVHFLPIEWNNVPYLFYTFSREGAKRTTLSFKGLQKSVGISNEYFRVAPSESEAIIRLCSAASEEFSPAVGGADVRIDSKIPADQVVHLNVIRAEKKLGGKLR